MTTCSAHLLPLPLPLPLPPLLQQQRTIHVPTTKTQNTLKEAQKEHKSPVKVSIESSLELLKMTVMASTSHTEE